MSGDIRGRRWMPVRALVAVTLALALLVGTSGTALAQGYQASSGATYALNTSGELLGFDRSAPGQIDSRVAVSGLDSGESLVGLDFRPADGVLYGIGSNSQVYTIDPATGAATSVAPLTESLQGSVFEVDFNPSADAIRVVSDEAQNLRIDPDTGETTVDGTLAYAADDANAEAAPAVVAGAYSNNLPDVEETALYDFDLATGNYVQQDPPNDGILNTIGPVSSGFTGLTGFDITSLNGSDEGFAAIQTAEDQPSMLYSVGVESGTVSQIGVIGGGEYVSDIAIPTGMQNLPDTGGPAIDTAMLGAAGLLLSGGLVAGVLALRAQRN